MSFDRTRAPGAAPAARVTERSSAQAAAILRLQRGAGNRAARSLLQRKPKATHPENPPIGDLYAKGTLDQAAWKALHDQAEKARAGGDVNKATALYAQLLSDAAKTAGIGKADGFDPAQVHVGIGRHETVQGTGDLHRNTKPGLNLSMESGDEPGHTGWVDASGTFSNARLELTRGNVRPKVGIIINYAALKPEKALSMRTIRHEMVHAKHKLLILHAIRTWEKAPGKKKFGTWLDENKGRRPDVHTSLIRMGVAGGISATEVLAHVEGFMTDFHHTDPKDTTAGGAYFQLLGAVEKGNVFTWSSVDRAIKQEALARLRGYYTSLGQAHKDAWKAWLAKEVAKKTDEQGRKDFLGELEKFVK